MLSVSVASRPRPDQAKSFPVADLTDLLSLASSIFSAVGGHLVYGPNAILTAWFQRLAQRYAGKGAVVLSLPGKRILLVVDRDLSVHILSQPPSQSAYLPGRLKVKAMTLLAPHALTISHDQEWLRWRAFNEAVLCPGSPHPDRAVHLPTIRAAFSTPLQSLADIRQRLGAAMLAVVFGVDPGAPGWKAVDLMAVAEDVQQLADLVNKPLRRLVLGPFQRGRRERVYEALREVWQASSDGSPPGSLLARAHAVDSHDFDREVLLEQLPHWMFTFQGSASTLFGRTLVLLLSQPGLLEKVREEVRTVCGSDGPSSEDQIARLRLLEACVMETGRLYPPVPLTVHRRASEEIHDGRRVPADTDILQLFVLLQRPQLPFVEASEFQPSSWLDRPGACPFSDVFLSGARTCPGKDLILFVIKTGLATILAGRLPTVPHGAFRQARWPLSFPDRLIRFTASPSPS